MKSFSVVKVRARHVEDVRQRFIHVMQKRYPESDRDTVKLEDGICIGPGVGASSTAVLYRIKELLPLFETRMVNVTNLN